MTLIVDMAALEERCVQCGMPWIQHPVDEEGIYGEKGEYYCRDVTESVIHVHVDATAICSILAYANWMRIMENPEEAVP